MSEKLKLCEHGAPLKFGCRFCLAQYDEQEIQNVLTHLTEKCFKRIERLELECDELIERLQSLEERVNGHDKLHKLIFQLENMKSINHAICHNCNGKGYLLK